MTKRQLMIEETKKIIEQYSTRLTLRQIYYRLVSKHTIPNTKSQYQYLSKVLVEARHNGSIPFDAIEDRTRIVIGEDKETETPTDYFNRRLRYLEDCWSWYNLPKWKDQPKYIEVWLEKRALQTLFGEVTEQHEVKLAPCGGYPSLTYCYEAAKRFNKAVNYHAEGLEIVKDDIECHILYFGDFDPSGEDIYRHIGETFERFGLVVNFEKVALNLDQIKEYQLPPMPAKKTDARATGFIEEYGDMAVELDALEPNILQEMVDEAIKRHFDSRIYEGVASEINQGQDEIKALVEGVLNHRGA